MRPRNKERKKDLTEREARPQASLADSGNYSALRETSGTASPRSGPSRYVEDNPWFTASPSEKTRCGRLPRCDKINNCRIPSDSSSGTIALHLIHGVHLMNRKLLVLSIVPAFALLGMSHDTQAPAQASTLSVPSQQGLILNIDPVTGAIIDHPAAGTTKLAVPAELAAHMSTSDDGLLEQPNPSGGKGMYVNLQGRYQNAIVATVDANGKLSTPCAQGLNTAANTASHK